MRRFEEGLDQPMDEEANMLKDMNKEKVATYSVLLCFTLFHTVLLCFSFI